MPKAHIALITDSTCDIPDSLLEQYEIAFASCYIQWGEDSRRDRVDMQATEFYRRLQSDPQYPTTSQPTPGDFVALYEEAQARGAQGILVITLSSELSGTYLSAVRAAEFWAGREGSVPVRVVDSRGVTTGLGWQVLAAARARDAATSSDPTAVMDTMVAAADRARTTINLTVCLDTVEYLYKGGRIGNAARFLATALKLKPLVYVDHVSGVVEPAQRVRTRRRSVDALYHSFVKALGARPGQARVAVAHGDALEEAEALASRVQRGLAPKELLITITSPVLGVHTGPRALALCGYLDD